MQDQTTTTTTTIADAIAAAGIRLHPATQKAATALDSMLRAEYPALRLGFDATDGKIETWTVTHVASDTEVHESTKVPRLADVLERCEEEGLDPTEVDEDEDEDEPQPSGSVVPEHYRQQYRAASSNGQTCGDWLAEWLVAQTHSATGFMVDDFTAILVNNGVDLNTKWGQLPASGQKGWIGRYRMNGRQVLEKIVAKNGKLTSLLGQADTVPEEALAILRGKHAKWLAKEAKREAAMEAAIKASVEG